MSENSTVPPGPSEAGQEAPRAVRIVTGAFLRASVTALGMGFVLSGILALLVVLDRQAYFEISRQFREFPVIGVATVDLCRRVSGPLGAVVFGVTAAATIGGTVGLILGGVFAALDKRWRCSRRTLWTLVAADIVVPAVLFGAVRWSQGNFVGELHRFTGHTGEVTSVAFSPGGRYVASAGGVDETLRIWDLQTERELHRCEGHTGQVTSIAFFPDGDRLLSGSYDKTLRIWDVKTGRLLHTLVGHGGLVESVAVSSSGRVVLSGSGPNFRLGDGGLEKVGDEEVTLRVWEADSGKELYGFRRDLLFKFDEYVEAVALSSDARLALSMGGKTPFATSVLRLWNVETGKELRIWAKNEIGEFRCAVFTPDARRALTGSGIKLANGKEVECVVTVWDVETGKELKRLEGHTDGVHSVAVSPDGRRALSGSADGTMRLWDLESGQERQRFIGHSKCVSSVAFSPDGKSAVSGSWDNSVRVWALPK